MSRLTKADIKRASNRRKYSDGRGLFLSVSANGRKSWAFCYTSPITGKPREMGLGSIDFLDIEAARKKVMELRDQVRSGVDPLGERKTEARTLSRRRLTGTTFREVAMRLIDKKRPGWTENGRSEEAWTSSLTNHAFPLIGDMDVEEITMFEVRDLLLRIWEKNNVVARRVMNRIELVMDFAAVEGLRTGDNPAHSKKLQLMLPDVVHQEEHQAALPYADIPDFIVELRTELGVAPRALEFAILTALRTGDVIGATWDEIDLRARVWTIPASRMKNKKGKRKPEDHMVPLCDRAIEILEALPTEENNPFVFISKTHRKNGKGLSNMAMLKLLQQDMKRDVTVHGFRSTFRDWAAEETEHPDFVAEKALAHVIKNKVEAAYRRGALFEKRRALMNDWAAYCDGRLPLLSQEPEPLADAA
jgi:integrase